MKCKFDRIYTIFFKILIIHQKLIQKMWCIKKKSFLWESEKGHNKDYSLWILFHSWFICLWSHPYTNNVNATYFEQINKAWKIRKFTFTTVHPSLTIKNAEHLGLWSVSNMELQLISLFINSKCVSPSEVAFTCPQIHVVKTNRFWNILIWSLLKCTQN
jgi:hypothetical protein